jgi:hypothetical protein
MDFVFRPQTDKGNPPESSKKSLHNTLCYEGFFEPSGFGPPALTAVAAAIVHDKSTAVVCLLKSKFQISRLLVGNPVKSYLEPVDFFHNIFFCRRIQRQSKLRPSSAHTCCEDFNVGSFVFFHNISNILLCFFSNLHDFTSFTAFLQVFYQ